jgi:predicted transglutaminase-like cysteine proteinase
MDRILASFRRMGGTADTLRDWQLVIQNSRHADTEEKKLKRVNEFFNRRIAFGEDLQIWGRSDYWATPLETLVKGKGDCEDFAIAKYFTLRAMGIPNEQLKLVYVKAHIGGADSTVSQAHMVLAYYPLPDADPLVLDNLITDVRPASRRPDLVPVFSFNSDGIWQGTARAEESAGVGRLSRWQDLLLRARAEGFD